MATFFLPSPHMTESLLSRVLPFFFKPQCGLRDLSSLTRDWTRGRNSESVSPNHWTTREFPVFSYKTTDSIMRASPSSESNYLSKAPSPNTITLGTRALIWNGRGGGYHLIHISHVLDKSNSSLSGSKASIFSTKLYCLGEDSTSWP